MSCAIVRALCAVALPKDTRAAALEKAAGEAEASSLAAIDAQKRAALQERTAAGVLMPQAGSPSHVSEGARVAAKEVNWTNQLEAYEAEQKQRVLGSCTARRAARDEAHR